MTHVSPPTPRSDISNGIGIGADGFTLIEMIVVLIALGLVLGLVIARVLAHSARLDRDAAGRQVVGVLRAARSLAIAGDRVAAVTFAPGRYRVPGGYRMNEGAPVAFPGDVALAGDRVIRFTPDGRSSDARIVSRNGVAGGDRRGLADGTCAAFGWGMMPTSRMQRRWVGGTLASVSVCRPANPGTIRGARNGESVVISDNWRHTSGAHS